MNLNIIYSFIILITLHYAACTSPSLNFLSEAKVDEWLQLACRCDTAEQCACDTREALQSLQSAVKTYVTQWEEEKNEWRREMDEERESLEETLLEQCEHSGGESSTGVSRDDSKLSRDGRSSDPMVAERAADAQRLRAQLELLQYPDAKHCDALPQLHFNYRQMGLGAAWHGMTLALTYAFATHRTVTVDPQPVRWIWSDKNRCGEKTMSCWLEPIGSCAATIKGPHAQPDYAAVDDQFKKDNVEFDWFEFEKGGAQPEHSVYMKQGVWNRGNQYVPAPYRKHGLFWWRSQLLSFVVRPSKETLATIDEVRDSLQWAASRPICGVHIRRGAKWTETKNVDVSVYMDRVAALPDVRSVFVATDDQGVIEAIENKYGSKYTILYVKDTFRFEANREVKYMDEIRRRWKAASKDAVDVIKDVWLLADSDYFVGTFSSNIGRTVAELMYARSNVDPRGTRAFSVDRDWFVDP